MSIGLRHGYGLAHDILRLGDTAVIPEIHGIGMVVEHDADDLYGSAVLSVLEGNGGIADGDVGGTGVNGSGGITGALTNDHVYIQTGFLIPALVQSHIVRRMVSGNGPVEQEVDRSQLFLFGIVLGIVGSLDVIGGLGRLIGIGCLLLRTSGKAQGHSQHQKYG